MAFCERSRDDANAASDAFAWHLISMPWTHTCHVVADTSQSVEECAFFTGLLANQAKRSGLQRDLPASEAKPASENGDARVIELVIKLMHCLADCLLTCLFAFSDEQFVVFLSYSAKSRSQILPLLPELPHPHPDPHISTFTLTFAFFLSLPHPHPHTRILTLSLPPGSSGNSRTT